MIWKNKKLKTGLSLFWMLDAGTNSPGGCRHLKSQCSSYLSVSSQGKIKQLNISPADTRPSANTVIEMAGGSHSGQ